MPKDKYNFPFANGGQPAYDFSFLDNFAPEAAKNNDDDGILTAAYHGLAGATGNVIRAGGNLLNYYGKPAKMTEEEWDKQMQAAGGLRAFANRTNKSIEQFGKEMEDAHARSYSDPFSAASIANAAVSVIPYAVGLGITARMGAPTAGEAAAAETSSSAMAVKLAPYLSKIAGKYGDKVAANAPKYMAPIVANIELGQKQALPEAMLESVTSGKLDYIDDAKRNGTYVPGVTEQEAERVAKGVLTDNLMFITGTDTMQDALVQLIGGKKGGILKKAAKGAGIGGGINAVQEMGQQIIPKMERGDEWSLTDPDVLLSGLVGALTGGAPTLAGGAYGQYVENRNDAAIANNGGGNSAEREAFINAIAGQESEGSGGYNAVNGRTGAAGKYQILPDNWPRWSQEAGLGADAPMTPENQEIVARYKLGEYYDKYGPRGAAMAWYGGEGSLKYSDEALNRKQGNGDEPSINEYADSVLARMGQTPASGTDAGATSPNARQAKSYLQSYLEEMAAGDEYNAIDTILSEGSDEDVIAKAVELGYGKQEEAETAEPAEQPTEPQPQQQPVDATATPEEQQQAAIDAVNAATNNVVNGGQVIEPQGAIQQQQAQPVVQQPTVQQVDSQPIQPAQTVKGKNLQTLEDKILNVRKTVDRIAKNKGEGAIQLSDEDAARYIQTASGDNLSDLIDAAEKLKIKVPKDVRNEAKRQKEERLQKEAQERSSLRGVEWNTAETAAIGKSLSKQFYDKFFDPETGNIKDNAFTKNNTAKKALSDPKYDGLGTRAMEGDEAAREQLSKLKNAEKMALLDRARRAALGEVEDKAKAKTDNEKGKGPKEPKQVVPNDDSIGEFKEDKTPIADKLGDKNFVGKEYGLPVYKADDSDVKYLLNEKMKKVHKMGKGINEWLDFDSAELAKDFIAKDGGNKNASDENGTGENGNNKGSENPVQDQQSQEPVEKQIGNDKGEGKNGEVEVNKPTEETDKGGDKGDGGVQSEPADKGEKPKKRRKIEMEDLDDFTRGAVEGGDVTLEELNILFGDLDEETDSSETNTDVQSKEDEEVEAITNNETLKNESKKLDASEEKFQEFKEKFAESDAVGNKKLDKYLTKHPDERDFLIDICGKNPKLLVSTVADKKSKSGTREVYYVVYDGEEKPRKVTNAEADFLKSISGEKKLKTLDEYKKQQKAEAQTDAAAEEENYLESIPEDAADDFLENLKKDLGKDEANKAADLLFSDSPIKDKGGEPLTWDEAIRQAVFKDLKTDDNKELDKLEKANEKKIDEKLSDFYWAVFDKYDGQVKRTTRGSYNSSGNASMDDIMAVEEATKNIKDPSARDDDVAPKALAKLREQFPGTPVSAIPSEKIIEAVNGVLQGKKQEAYQEVLKKIENQQQAVDMAQKIVDGLDEDFEKENNEKLAPRRKALEKAADALEKAKSSGDAAAILNAKKALDIAQKQVDDGIKFLRNSSASGLKMQAAQRTLTDAKKKLKALQDELQSMEDKLLAENAVVRDARKEANRLSKEANEAVAKAKNTKNEDDKKTANAANKRAQRAKEKLEEAKAEALKALKGEKTEEVVKEKDESTEQAQTPQEQPTETIELSQESMDSLKDFLVGLGNMKFKANETQKTGLAGYNADLFSKVLFAGSEVMEKAYKNIKNAFGAWVGQMKTMLDSAAASLDSKAARMLEFAKETLRAAYTFLKAIPQGTPIFTADKNELQKRRKALGLAGAAVSKGITPADFKKLLQQKMPQTLEEVKDYIDPAFKGLRYYPRQDNPDVIKLLQEINGGDSNEPIRTAGTTAPSNSGRGNENGVEGEPGSAVGGSTVQSKGQNQETGSGVSGQESTGGGSNGGTNVHGSGAVAGGTRSDNQGGAEVPDASQRSTGGTDDRGSGRGSEGRESVTDNSGNKPTSSVSASHEEQDADNETAERIAAQEKIKKGVPIKVADKANIAETLPVLLPEQRQDVVAIEDRFFGKEKAGILVANGTGTGKTLVGLGTIKRFLLQGKDKILIVVPSQEIGNNWVNDGSKYLQIDETARITRGKPEKGVPNIITYASLGMNKEIQSKNWDLIICDEAHHIISGANRSDIGGMEDKGVAALALRGLFGHKADGFDGYMRIKAQELYTQRAELAKKAEKLAEQLEGVSNNMIAVSPSLKRKKEQLDKLNKAIDDLGLKILAKRKEEKPKYEALMKNRDTKTLLLSATPFAYPQNAFYGEGLLFNYSDPGYGGSAGGFLTNVFGFNVTASGKIKPRRDTNGMIADNTINEVKFHDALVESGAMISRRLDIDKDYNRQFVKVEDEDGRIKKVEDGFKKVREYDDSTGLFDAMQERFSRGGLPYLLECVKVRAAIPMIESYVSRGKKVVLFHDRLDSKVSQPFALSDKELKKLTPDQQGAYNKFKRENKELVDYDFSNNMTPKDSIMAAFGQKAVFINGQESKADRAAAVKTFNDDNSNVNVVMVSSAAGQEGISLHDTTGKHQRVLINLGMPVRPTAAIQIEGRIYRYGSKSNAIFRYLSTNSDMERVAFYEKIATRSKTAENIALGSDARALDIAFQSGFTQAQENINPVDYETDEADSGGKAKDALSRKDALKELARMANASGNVRFKAAAEKLQEQEKQAEKEAKENAKAAEDAAKRQEILAPKNKRKFEKEFAEAVHATDMKEVADGVYVATLPNGRNLWLNTNTSQAAVLSKMSDEQKQRMLSAADIKGSGFEIQGFYGKELKNGGLVDVIHLTEAVKDGTLDHETMHFVFNTLLTAKEREDLMRYYKWKMKREMGEEKFNKLSEQEVNDRCEEAISDEYAALAAYDKGISEAPVQINNIAKKILWKAYKWLNRILEKIGVNTPDGIYLATRSGRMFNRGANESGKQNSTPKTLAVNKDVDLNQNVNVVEIGQLLPQKISSAKELKPYLQKLIKDGDGFDTADKKAVMSILPKDLNHIAYSSNKKMRSNDFKVRNNGIANLGDLINSAVLIESIPNRKTDAKPKIRAYHRFYVPVKIGSKIYTIRLVAEEQNGEITLNPSNVNLYDVIVEKNPHSANGANNAPTRADREGSSVISIKEMLQGVKDYDKQPYIQSEPSYSATEQPDGKLNFKVTPVDEVNGKALPDDLKAVLEEATKKAEKDHQNGGNIKVNHKTLTQTAKDKVGGVFDATLRSPSRLAEKNPIFKSFYNIYSRAQEVQEKLRGRWRKQFQSAVTELKSAEDMNNFIELMMSGEMEQKEYTLKELADAGYSKSVRDAYSRTRQLIRNVWEAVNDAHRGLEHIEETMSGKELEKLTKEPFIENIRVLSHKLERNDEGALQRWVTLDKLPKIVPGVNYEVKYDKPKVYSSSAKEQLTAEQLAELKKNPYALVTNVVQKRIGGEGGISYFEAKVKRVVPPIGKIVGYLPHMYEQWMVLAETQEGLVPVGSGKNLKEAYKVAQELQKKGGESFNLQIAPKLFDPNNVLGGGTDSKKGGLVVSDAEYIRLQRALVDNAKMSVPEARKALEGAVSRTARNRFFGNLQHRKGRVGYNSDVITTLDRYLLSSSRYCALQPAKNKATKLFEKTFGRWDKDYSGKEAMASIVKRYMMHNNGTPSYLEQVINSTLAKNDWIVKHVNATYGDRLGVAISSRINGFLSKNLLGCLNISSALVGVTQLVNTYGLIGKYTGVGMEAAKRMNMTDRKVLVEAGVPYNIGLDTPSGFSKRRNAIEGRKEGTFQQLRSMLNTVGEKGMFLFKEADKLTRTVTTLGAYYEALYEKGMTHKQAIAYAKKINREANFDYGSSDAPGIFQMTSGTVFGDLALLFQKYPMKEFELMRSLIPYFGKGTQAQKARFWAAYMLMSGFAGIPGGDWLDDLLEKLLGYKPSTVLKEQLFKHMGDNPLTRTIIYGIFSNLGIDISRRVGMGGMFPDSDSMLGYLTGPAGSVFWNGIQSATSGDFIKATKTLNPALGNIAEAVRGYSTNKKGQVSYKYEGMERYLKGMGFRPVGQSIEADMTSALYIEKTRSKDKRQKLLMDAARKRADGVTLTQDELSELRKAGVTGAQLRNAVKDLQMTSAERTKKALNKKQRKEFADNPLLQ